jgi:hypothetical protein
MKEIPLVEFVKKEAARKDQTTRTIHFQIKRGYYPNLSTRQINRRVIMCTLRKTIAALVLTAAIGTASACNPPPCRAWNGFSPYQPEPVCVMRPVWIQPRPVCVMRPVWIQPRYELREVLVQPRPRYELRRVLVQPY